MRPAARRDAPCPAHRRDRRVRPVGPPRRGTWRTLGPRGMGGRLLAHRHSRRALIPAPADRARANRRSPRPAARGDCGHGAGEKLSMRAAKHWRTARTRQSVPRGRTELGAYRQRIVGRAPRSVPKGPGAVTRRGNGRPGGGSARAKSHARDAVAAVDRKGTRHACRTRNYFRPFEHCVPMPGPGSQTGSQQRQTRSDATRFPAIESAAKRLIRRHQATHRDATMVPSKQRVAGSNPAGRASLMLYFCSLFAYAEAGAGS